MHFAGTTGILFGLVPALGMFRAAPVLGMTGASTLSPDSSRRARSRSLQVVGEITVAMALLVGAGLLIHIAAGLASAAAHTRLMESILVGVAPLDPPAFAGATLLLLAAVVIASYRPARVNPAERLESE